MKSTSTPSAIDKAALQARRADITRVIEALKKDTRVVGGKRGPDGAFRGDETGKTIEDFENEVAEIDRQLTVADRLNLPQ